TLDRVPPTLALECPPATTARTCGSSRRDRSSQLLRMGLPAPLASPCLTTPANVHWPYARSPSTPRTRRHVSHARRRAGRGAHIPVVGRSLPTLVGAVAGTDIPCAARIGPVGGERVSPREHGKIRFRRERSVIRASGAPAKPRGPRRFRAVLGR